MNGSQGEGAKKRLPQRRLNFIDGMVSSHCGVLNSDERLNLIRQANEVSGVMADLEAERLQKRDDQRKKKAQEESKSEERHVKKAAKEKEMMERGLLLCRDIMEQLDIQGNVIFNSFKVSELTMLIRYQFKSDAYKKKGIKKPELKLVAVKLYAEYILEETPIAEDVEPMMMPLVTPVLLTLLPAPPQLPRIADRLVLPSIESLPSTPSKILCESVVDPM